MIERNKEYAREFIREFAEKSHNKRKLQYRTDCLRYNLNECIQNVFNKYDETRGVNLQFHAGYGATTVNIGVPQGKSLPPSAFKELQEYLNITHIEDIGEFTHEDGTSYDMLFKLNDNMEATRMEIIECLEKRNTELKEELDKNKNIIHDLKEGGDVIVTGR